MKDSYVGAILKEIDSKFDLLLEIVTTLAPLPGQVRAIDERLSRVESNLEAAIKVITGHSQELKHHELRLTNLETP